MNSPRWIALTQLVIIIIRAGNSVHYGDTAEVGNFKYMAYILIYFPKDCTFCGGAIISKKHILTAAHCVVDSGIVEIVAISGSVRTDDWISAMVSDIENVHVHPDYRPKKGSSLLRKILWNFFPNFFAHPEEAIAMKNDIAVLTLGKDPPIGGNIAVVDLPVHDSLPYCIDLDYAGWGETENGSFPTILKTTKYIILTPQQCTKNVAGHRDNEFCAIAVNGRSRIAEGDSGSPLVFMNMVYGIASTGCSNPKIPCIFTKVYSHDTFIRKALRN